VEARRADAGAAFNVRAVKIVLLVGSLGSGGAERVASTLCNAWVDRGDTVTLIPTFSGGGESFYELDSRVELLFLASVAGIASRRNKRYVRRVLALRALIAARKPHVVISFMPNVNVAALAATVFSRIPCIVCERSDPLLLPMSRAWRLACRASYPAADAVTVQTEAAAQRIGSVYRGIRRLRTIPNPLPSDLPRVSSRRLSPDRRKTLLSLGRLSDEKRVDLIVEAFAGVTTAHPDWDLRIYGDGPLRERVAEQIARSGLCGRVHLMGRTTVPWQALSEADAFAMASEFEGFPNALLEAMGIGLPCIASDCPNGPREITRNGIDARLVPVGDVPALRAAMLELMADAQVRVELGQRARDSVHARYALPAVLQQWDALFKEVGAGT
jgi:GalNAc-alpha-(1->4)-GalNAc-alpha-(1->3)-diNAcBac-PP-undecaprenol alpha-1,4-N-acetyl-D-galactosaminyltransferase